MAHIDRLHCLCACDLWDLQRFYNEYFVDTDSEDDPTLFEWFPAEDIRRRSDHLMNLGLDREVTVISRSVDGDPLRGLHCFQVRKQI